MILKLSLLAEDLALISILKMKNKNKIIVQGLEGKLQHKSLLKKRRKKMMKKRKREKD
jgi:hypothetical protein